MRLGERAVARDAATFVARERELARLGDLLADSSPHRIAVVGGAAGAGKTALVREAARRAEARGFRVVWIDARELRTRRELPARLAEAALTERTLLVLDSAEGLGAGEAWLREEGLAGLDDTTRVVVVSRRPLEAAWWGSSWAASLATVTVGPLESGAAAAFLAARGVRDTAEVAAVLAWAEGHALSLTLAAAVRGTRDRPLDAADLAGLEADLLDQLTGGRLDGAEVLGEDRLVLAVAALAPAVDAALLGAVLPERDGADAERWLRGLPFAERLGHRVTLHQRVRRLLAAQLRDADPHVERELRVRIIDHLAVERAGRPELVVDVREVLAPPQDRGVTPSSALASAWRAEPATPDADLSRVLAHRDPGYVRWFCGWVRRAPAHVLVVRRPDGGIVAAALWATSESVPAGAAEDPVLGPWLAAADPWGGGTLFQPATEIAVPALDLPEVSALLLAELVRRCGLADFRRWVVPRQPPAPDPAHCGGVPDGRFDVRVGGVHLPGHVIDYGPAGVVAAMRVQAQAVLEPAIHPSVGPDEVREALRHAHDPVWLATSSLARGSEPAERAASVLALLREAVDQAFGHDSDARLQREVLRLGYLEPDAGHARAMRTLHLSRTTYFRRLREATATVAAWLAVRS